MVPQNRPYQIQELSENKTLKFVWIFPLLPVDVSYKMEDKYSFYGANKIKGYSKKFIKKQAEEIGRNDIEDTLMIKDISNITFDLNLRSFENTSERPKLKQQPKEINGIFVYKRDRTTAFHALQLADFKCEISKRTQIIYKKKYKSKLYRATSFNPNGIF